MKTMKMDYYRNSGNDYFNAPTNLEIGSATRLHDSRPLPADFGHINAVFESTVTAAGTFFSHSYDGEKRVFFGSPSTHSEGHLKSKSAPSAASPDGSQGSADEDIESPEEQKKAKSKKGKRFRPRDSLNSRMQVGKPGSRRHQRFLNKSHLTDEETDEDDPFGLINGEGEVPEWNSTFKDVLESEANKVFMEPFLNTSLDDEEEFLSSLQEPEKEKRSDLDKLSKKMLIKYHKTDFLEDLDKHICSFAEAIGIDGELNQHSLASHQRSEYFETTIDLQKEKMVIKFKDSFHRFLAHSVCRYYSLTSNSETKSGGQRLTIITLPRSSPRPLAMPTLTLDEYLTQERRLISSKA